MGRTRAKKIARIAGLVSGGLLLLCLLALVALLLWLRTPHAAHMLYGLASDKLQEKGVYIAVDDIAGPLPFALHVKGLRVADAQGPWLETAALDVEISPFALLRGYLNIDSVIVTRPRLLRSPELPQQQNSAAMPDQDTDAAAPDFSLPVQVVLDEMRVVQGTVRPTATDTQALEQAGAFALLDGLAVDARLSASIEQGVLIRSVLHANGEVSLTRDGALDKADQTDQPDRHGRINALCTLRLEDLRLALSGSFKAQGGLRLEVNDGSIYERLGLSTQVEGHNQPLWGRTSLALQGTSQFDSGALVFNVRGNLQADSSHPYFSATGVKSDFTLQGMAQEMLASFKVLRVEGMGLLLDGQGSWNLRNFAARLEADLNIQRDGPWYQVVSTLADTQAIPTANIKGRLDASLRPNAPGAQSVDFSSMRLAASIDVLADGIRWPAGVLHEALGEYAAVQGDFSGPLFSPYRADIKRASTGKSPQGDTAAPSTAKASGWYELALPGVLPPHPDAGHALAEQKEHLAMYASVEGSMPDFGAFLPEGSGTGGPVEGRATMFGLIKDVGSFFDFTAQGNNAAGMPLDTPLEQITSLAAKAQARLALGNGLDLRGTAEAKGAMPKSGEVTAHSGWFLNQPPGQPLVIGLEKLQADAAGGELTGYARASFVEAGPQAAPTSAPEAFSGASSLPAFDGELLLHVMDWRNVNALLRRLNLPVVITKAAEGDVSLSIESAKGKATERFSQNAVLTLALPEVRAKMPERAAPKGIPTTTDEPEHARVDTAGAPAGEAAPYSGYAGNIQGRIDLTDLYGVPVLNAYIKTDEGMLGPVEWKSFAVYLDLSGKSGRINLAMRSDGKAMEYAQKVEEAMPDFASLRKISTGGRVRIQLLDAGKELPPPESHIQPNELLVLQSGFNLEPLEMVLHRMVLHAPSRSAGLFSRGPAYIYWGDAISVKKLSLGMLTGGQADCEADFGAGKTHMTLSLRDVPLETARIFTDFPLPEGNINAEARLYTNQGQVGGDASLKALLQPLHGQFDERYGSAPMLLTLQGRLEETPSASFPEIHKTGVQHGVIRLHGAGGLSPQNGANTGKSDLSLSFDFPFALGDSGVPGLHYTAPLGLRMLWNGNVRNIWYLLPIPDRELRGLARCGFEVGGNLAGLKYSGEAYLAGGRYEDKVAGLLVTDIDAELKTTDDGALFLLSAKDGAQGHAALEARLADAAVLYTGLGQAGGRGWMEAFYKPQVSARGQINHFAPLRRDDIYARVSGLIDAKGPLAEPEVKIDLTVERGDVNILSTLGGSVSTLPVENREQAEPRARARGGPQLDIKVDMPNRLFIRGMGLDSEWQGKLAVRGPLGSPSFEGKVSPVRGYLNLLSRPFALGRGEVSFWGGQNFDSNIALQLTYSSTDLIAYINASGSALKPKLVLSSVPPMPQDQILSQVLFGKDVRQLSGVEALQVANGLRELVNFGSGAGSFDLLTGMRRFLGVDTLRVGSTADGMQNRRVSGSPGADAFGVGSASNADDTSSPTLEAGKYINDAIYIGVEQGAVEDSTRVRVEVELRPNLTLQGSSSVKSSDVGIGWKKDY